MPTTRRCTLGDRAFPVAAARAWNSLPLTVTSHVKCAHVFTVAYLKYKASRARCVAQCRPTVCSTARHYCRTANRIRRLHSSRRDQDISPQTYSPKTIPSRTISSPFLHGVGHLPPSTTIRRSTIKSVYKIDRGRSVRVRSMG